MSAPEAEPNSPRALRVLALGAVAGLALAAYGLLGDAARRGSLPDGVVASVNGSYIAADGYQRLVAGLDADTREPVTPELRRRVLDRMIDEELLVQRGLELGLAESDRRVRADITSAMIRSVVVEAEDDPPSDAQVAAFYAEEQAFFTQPGRIRARQVFVRVSGPEGEEAARARAVRAYERLAAGESLAAVRDAEGDREVSPVPDALLPPAKLREYVGPTALRAVMALPAGGLGEPVRSGTGYHVFQVVAREEQRVPPLEEIREQVRAEYVRRAGDLALRSYLDQLRGDAEVVVRDELP